jgi:hypothetical protein
MPPPIAHETLHVARLRYYARRLAAMTDSRERAFLAAEIAFERRTLGELGVDASEVGERVLPDGRRLPAAAAWTRDIRRRNGPSDANPEWHLPADRAESGRNLDR